MSAQVFAPGAVVVVRDEEWLVTQVEETADGQAVTVQGISDLVRGQDAVFFESLDDIAVLDPRNATIKPDGSPRYRDSRLWLESTLRKTPVPLGDAALTVSTRVLSNPLGYQQKAVAKALDPANLRPRILLADAVGLGKTLEIGMILAELIRRGRGERILIVTPRHVLEQMQHEMWSRFAIPFVRLDSQGVARVKQKLPANRNPFTYFRRVIISMDTLKQERFVHDLRRHHWDAVVIDESHNATNADTQNNRLATILAPQTDALILASATPHNGKAESFANLVRLLDPTAVSVEGELDLDRVQDLVIRRHRHSPEVANEVGSDWAERREPDNRLVPASPAENAVVDELVHTWLRPAAGSSPYSGENGRLFPWTLAKAFLSSPAALEATLTDRLARLGDTVRERREADALTVLLRLNDACQASSSKYTALVDYLREIGIGPKSDARAVIFSERVATLDWLRERLAVDLRMRPDQIDVLHGGLGDDQQQGIVESFKQSSSPIRVLVTGDVASEGVNLHKQCHHLIHYDIPWSLIRIEQRNGRIDRYGQLHSPQITTLLLSPDDDTFAGDIKVLTKLVSREQEVHKSLGDAASIMGKYSVKAEEEEILRALAGVKRFEDVVPDAPVVEADDMSWLDELLGADASDVVRPDEAPARLLYPRAVDFLSEALAAAYPNPEEAPQPGDSGGVGWRRKGAIVEFVPPADLVQRLDVLPQTYLTDRQVRDNLRLVTDHALGAAILEDALTDASSSSWPEAHYLGPLHPVLDWAADRALATLGRNEVYAVRGQVAAPTVLLNGTLINKRGQVVASSWLLADFTGERPAIRPYPSAPELFEAVGVLDQQSNPGPVDLPERSLIRPAVDAATAFLSLQMGAAESDARMRVDEWVERTQRWQHEADALIQRHNVVQNRALVRQQEELSRDMMPDRQLVRPLLVVLPEQKVNHG